MPEASEPNSRRKVGKGARIAALVLGLVIVAAGAILLLPATGLKWPAFLPNLALFTAKLSEAVSRQAMASPGAEGSQAATVLPPATATATPTPRPLATSAATATVPQAVVATAALNVRTGPGTNYPKIYLLHKGDRVVVTGRNKAGDWLAVTLAGGKKGWVAASLVKLDVPVSGIAVAQNIPKPPTPAVTRKPAAPTAALTITGGSQGATR